MTGLVIDDLSMTNNAVGTKARGGHASVMLLGVGLGIRRATSLEWTLAVVNTHFMDSIDMDGPVRVIRSTAYEGVRCGLVAVITSSTSDGGVVGIDIEVVMIGIVVSCTSKVMVVGFEVVAVGIIVSSTIEVGIVGVEVVVAVGVVGARLARMLSNDAVVGDRHALVGFVVKGSVGVV